MRPSLRRSVYVCESYQEFSISASFQCRDPDVTYLNHHKIRVSELQIKATIKIIYIYCEVYMK